MQASDAAEHIVEINEESGDDAEADSFRNRTALLIAFMAMLLAIASLGGGNAAEDMMSSNIHASDTWAFYQAKNVRQTSYKLAADQLELELQRGGASLSPELRQSLERRIEEYRKTVTRYEDEPDQTEPDNPLKGEGKKQLTARAKDYETQLDRAQRQDPNVDFSEALYQIAIVLASVSILALSRKLLGFAVLLGALATVLMLNGYFLFFDLPF